MAQTLNRYLINPAEQVELNNLPDRLKNKLLPFQLEGLNFAVSKNGRCLIADEMGLGKTLQAIAVACYYKSEWPLLILLPASLKYQWVEELEKWLPELLPTDINMINNSSDVGNITKCKINIVAYSLLRYGNPNTSVLLKAIKAQKFKVAICDESHNIRNIKTRTANVVVDLVKNAVRCVLLSGTPALNKPSELYTQIDSILPGRFGSFNEYTLRYCNAHYVYYGGRSKVWNIDGAKNLDELELKLKQHLMIRRLKKEVLKQLPPKRRQKVPFDLKFDSNSAELQKELTAMQEELERLLSASGSSMVQVIQPSQGAPAVRGIYDIRVLISQLYTKTCHAKVGPVVEFVLFYTSGEDSNKVLVFAHHHAMMNSIQQALWNANIKHIRIDGRVPTSERNLLVKQFQSDPNTKVAVLSILAAGSGLTLTAASVVVFAELYWTPAMLMQCEDRAHRIGQTAQSVNIYYLVARGTIDERVWSMVEKKTRVLAMALDGQSKGLSAVNSNKHVSGILSSAQLKLPVEDLDTVEVDIDVEDFFALADLKDQSQPTLQSFLSQTHSPSSVSRKRPKRLVLRPADVSKVMIDSDDTDSGSAVSKRPKMNDKNFMSWALDEKTTIEPGSPSSSRSLPSLSSSPSQHSDQDSGDIIVIGVTDDATAATAAVVDTNTHTSTTSLTDTTTTATTATATTATGTATTAATATTATGTTATGTTATVTIDVKETDTEVPLVPGTPNTPTTPSAQQTDMDYCVMSSQTSDKDNPFTLLQGTKAYSPVNSVLQSSCNTVVSGDKKINELDEANFNIIPGRAAECLGSDMSGDLFSDASFEDEIMDEVAQVKNEGITPQVDKAEEARLAAQLLGDDDLEEVDNAEYWICGCQSVNDRELECCSKCALPRMPTTWTCRKCLTLNRLTDECCDECLTERDSSAEEHGEEVRHVDISSIPVHSKFYFLVSHHTSRIFLHDKDKKYLQSSFHSVDLDNPDLLPDVLLRQENLELAQEFVGKWNNLKKREQKMLIKKRELIDCPEKAYFGGRLTKLRKPNKQRYKSKSDVAKEAAKLCEDNPGAQTRTIRRPTRDMVAESQSDSLPEGYVQVMSADSKPLCISCHAEYETDLLSTSIVGDEKFGWQTRFCSPQCADNFLLKSHTGYIRSTAKSMDAGVCEQCGVSGSELFQQIKHSRSLKERAELLQRSRYSSLSAHVKVTMVNHPSEGQFWHVDHILPVYAGGGQCDVDNLRTLCTPCHQTITAAQAGHRARMRASIGNKTISDFFSPGTKEKLKSYD